MSKYAQWKVRKEGFDAHVKSIKSDIDKLPVKVAKDFKDFDDLTTSLNKFTTQLFCFFLNGFRDFLEFDEKKDEFECQDGEESKIKLIPSAEFPPEYVLQKILQQASFDLTVIERAIGQRKDPDLSTFLAQCDQLALSVLASAFPSKDPSKWLIDPVKPIVYFQRDTSVRIIPYANALLIGIPFSARFQPIDLLSIPHEVAHHVYQTGRFSETDPINLFFEKFFANQPDWIRNWLEEIFADLYGFLAAGPIVAFSLQEVLLDNLPGSLAEDDGDHPVGIIRPLIYSNLLNSDEYKVRVPGAEAIAEALRKKWQTEVTKRGFANEFMSVTGSKVIDGDEALKTLAAVLEAMNKQIQENTKRALDFPTSPDENRNSQPWSFFPSTDPSDSGDSQLDPKDPFAGFDIANVLKLQDNQINKVMQLYKDNGFDLSKKDQNEYLLTGQISYWNEKVGEKDFPLRPLHPNIWKLIFTAFNWAEQGPEDTRPV